MKKKKKTTKSNKSTRDKKVKQSNKTTNSKKSAQDKKNKKLEKTEMTTSVEQPKDIELIGKGIDIAKLEEIKKNLPLHSPKK